MKRLQRLWHALRSKMTFMRSTSSLVVSNKIWYWLCNISISGRFGALMNKDCPQKKIERDIQDHVFTAGLLKQSSYSEYNSKGYTIWHMSYFLIKVRGKQICGHTQTKTIGCKVKKEKNLSVWLRRNPFILTHMSLSLLFFSKNIAAL